MSDNALPKGYEPRDVESRWRAHWEGNKTFTPDLDAPGEPFSIVIPPPNVTGALHMGHALNLTIQDILCRHARQKGKKVLWVPGTDHAGIATQNVVERGLAKEGKGRHDLGREKFIERVWEWREEYGTRILNQIRAMGASVDWTRERFTMDEGLSRAVRQVFVKLYDDGLIYKGDYIINWCNRCHTALADDEVDHLPRKDHLWQLRYPLADGSGELVIATTRPETMFGDTAVCVHPEDERYTAFIGKMVKLPLTDREIPVIADNYVDREFGTGALKVTPSHDHNDWELGHRHKLEFLQVIDENGVMNEHAGIYAGLTKEECRKRVVADLAAQGVLVKEEELDHSVGHCYRCKSVIEPHVSTQWFVAASKMAPRARAAVPAATQIFPDNWEKTYYNWLDNIRDWCISRQIWWGHRIPAWTCGDCGKLIVSVDAPERCSCGSANLAQDEDVLDTWFSSALWPFSTMGWPDDTRELKTFYPTSVLVTGFDILFFWVARMMMMGLHFMDEVPFRHVYIHALVRDAEGRKMSKSTGNVIDPLEMIDKYGTDSLRFTLAAFAAMGRDIKLSEERIEGYRHFVNKLWNAARFALMNLPDDEAPAPVDLDTVQGLHHRWILHRLEEMKESTDAAITGYRFNDAAQGMYRFIWNEFCDWYLELIKPDMQAGGERKAAAQHVLLTVLRETLTLLHPIMPFITCEIWAALPGNAGTDLAVQPFPAARPGCVRAEDAARMELVQGVIGAVRTIRAELNIAPSLRLTALVRTANEHDRQVLEENRQMLLVLARLENAEFGPAIEAPRASASNVVSGNEVIVPLTGAVDFEAELARLDKELGKIEKDLVQVNKKLANESFVDKAPAEVVAKERARAGELADAKAKLEALQQRFREAIG
ncbi:valine--tRNA ligase [Nitratidesulfovibrio sp. SRB-5]|uniref:valine--tRNA ligase n=1 Tax=Nitratidesulfovibrio sp. SRB-5 TaxID=2872636 RepID=UPI0010269305|nr:valine--tRNA ligase [Nitratidesulfovibrio sp. SRB-5]MBZ2170938.1 valine--tRNA ligase [Nitratidesulfovibrio sp. SRB-5]RXF77875.1 valine--tRNA ligase [Desulfovibrio sp. DS-1]